MLVRTLRGLERDGLITRTVHPVVPPRVEYELTDIGRSLQGILAQLAQWAFAHAPEFARARDTYDKLESDHRSRHHDPEVSVALSGLGVLS